MTNQPTTPKAVPQQAAPEQRSAAPDVVLVPVAVVVAAYSPREEFANAVSHGLGTIAAVVALVLMLDKGWAVMSDSGLAAIAIYGSSLILLFLSSTIYHSVTTPQHKAVFKRLDHCAIYLLIAGTYTPMLTITLNSTRAHVLLQIIWAIAAAGVIFKMYFIHSFKRMSLITYLLMGWLAVLVTGDLWRSLPHMATYLLIGGGLCFTVGAGFYAAKKYSYTHAIWHLFVVAGAACHCLAIARYVIPSA